MQRDEVVLTLRNSCSGCIFDAVVGHSADNHDGLRPSIAQPLY